MLIHQLRQITRSLWKYKGFTAINLLGLSIGIAAVLLISLISDYERRFDRQHSEAEGIYRVVSRANRANEEVYQAAVPYPTARYLRQELSGLRATSESRRPSKSGRCCLPTRFSSRCWIMPAFPGSGWPVTRPAP